MKEPIHELEISIDEDQNEDFAIGDFFSRLNRSVFSRMVVNIFFTIRSISFIGTPAHVAGGSRI